MEQFFLTLDDGDTKVDMDIAMLASDFATDLGYCFEKGIEGFSQNYENALKCYESAAQKGDKTALNNVGWMYLNGYAVTKDEQIATGYFYKAAIKGSSCAMVNLGNIHESKKEYEAAWYWYLQAARLGDSKGIFNIANMLHWGWGVERDYNAAYNIFKKLYDSDYNPATCFYLGYYAENGLISSVDYESAHQYYKEGVFFDDKYCCTNLGRMYGLGIGCNKNSARAFALYDRAAELGDALGYTNMAWMYETGEFVPKDIDKAKEYYQKAADMGEENAIEAMDRIKEEMLKTIKETTMTNKEKIELLKTKLSEPCCLADYYLTLLERIGAIKPHYYDYMITEPINVDEELKRVETADFDLCGALLTLLLREDHFAQYGCFERRCEKGDVQKIIDRMILVLEDRECEIKKRLQGRASEYLLFMDD